MTLRVIITILLSSSFLYTAEVSAKGASGFLNEHTAPDSLAILPPPPAENTVLFLDDKAQYEIGHVLQDSDRMAVAAKDAEYHQFGLAFSEAFGTEISEKHTPLLWQLLTNVLHDSHDYAMRAAKDHYKRVRPFVVYKDQTCTPDKDAEMAGTGSYPSGHASFGWATALVLAEINPSRQTEIFQRGYEFGHSRVICGAHWQSDVDNGRIMGAAVVSALHSNPQFINSLGAAKKEFASIPQ